MNSKAATSASSASKRRTRPSFYEFFAGAGMVRAGLGSDWNCLFANDINPRKNRSYRLNWDDAKALVPGDIQRLTTADLPEHADLAWASFPCQDLSQAGRGAGLDGKKSGTFWTFWNLVANLRQENRAPTTIVLENVEGTLTSHKSEDFLAICRAFSDSRYRLGAVIIDAAHFVPQSRPRLFIIAVKNEAPPPKELTTQGPDPRLHTPRLLAAHAKLPNVLAINWIWWALPDAPPRTTQLIDILENEPGDIDWHPREKTDAILAKMNALHRSKMRAARSTGRPVAGTVYQRTRQERDGRKVQRCEVRFDGVAGCLRTPAGGSSLQVIVMVDGPEVRTRRISSREAARLMGLHDEYILPESYYEAYQLAGDGVAVPVVRFLAEHILKPLAAGTRRGDAIKTRQPASSHQPGQQQLDLQITDAADKQVESRTETTTMSEVTIEQHDGGTYTILINGCPVGELEYKAPTVWRARMTRYEAYTGREFTGLAHAQAFFDEQFGDKPVTYRWTIIWTDGKSVMGRAEGALAAYDQMTSTVTHATSPQRKKPKKLLLHTVARVDGELSCTTHMAPAGQHELNAEDSQFNRDRQGPGLPMHPPKTLTSA